MTTNTPKIKVGNIRPTILTQYKDIISVGDIVEKEKKGKKGKNKKKTKDDESHESEESEESDEEI